MLVMVLAWMIRLSLFVSPKAISIDLDSKLVVESFLLVNSHLLELPLPEYFAMIQIVALTERYGTSLRVETWIEPLLLIPLLEKFR